MDEKQEPNEEPDEVDDSSRRPRFGAMLGEIELRQGWEKPLSSEEADEFWEGR